MQISQQYYLENMGIVNWRLRQTQPATTSVVTAPFYLAELQDQQGLYGLVLADASTEEHVQPQEQRLLNAICQALNFPIATTVIYTHVWAEVIGKPRVVLLLGASIAEQYLCHPVTVIPQYIEQPDFCYLIHVSLRQLLQQPLLKAKLWEDIQPICNSLP